MDDKKIYSMEEEIERSLPCAISNISETMRSGDDKLAFEASKLLIQLYLKTAKASDDVVGKELNDSFKAINRKLEGK